MVVVRAKAGTQRRSILRASFERRIDRHRTPCSNASMADRSCWVDMLASRRNGTLYVGVTSDLVRRAWEHRTGAVQGFTKTYHVHDLVGYEGHATAEAAIAREKQIKRWNRAWKLELIEAGNPYWNDLYSTIVGEGKDAGSPLLAGTTREQGKDAGSALARGRRGQRPLARGRRKQ